VRQPLNKKEAIGDGQLEKIKKFKVQGARLKAQSSILKPEGLPSREIQAVTTSVFR
jgi:hypothetical protein